MTLVATGIKFETYAGSPSTIDWTGGFAGGTDTLKFSDGAVGDTTTYEVFTGSGTILGCYDMGAPTTINTVKFVVGGTSVYGIEIAYANTFGTWTTITTSLTVTNQTISTGGISARYWMLYLGATNPQISDLRLYDVSNNLVLPPGSIVPPNAPTITAFGLTINSIPSNAIQGT